MSLIPQQRCEIEGGATSISRLDKVRLSDGKMSSRSPSWQAVEQGFEPAQISTV